jgi:hypothetical protein
LAVLGVCILLAGLFGLRAYNAPKPTLRAAPAAPVSSHEPWTKAIQDVCLGEKTLGTNPLTEERERTLPDPDPETWRELHFHMTKANGLSLWIELLRSLEWIEAVGAAEGGSIYLELPEMGAVGQAEITHLGPCPDIQSGEGNVVTGKFTHEADGNVVELLLADQPEPTRVTDNHSYWSEDRQAFVPVGKLRPDERVRTLRGTTTVVSVTPIDYQGFLYNLETHGEHVYMVGSLGTLVHNNCAQPGWFKSSQRISQAAWQATKASRPLSHMGHAAKHLKDFQKIHPDLSAQDVAKILEYVRATGRVVPGLGKHGATVYEATVQIGSKSVTVRAVESLAGIIKSSFPL